MLLLVQSLRVISSIQAFQPRCTFSSSGLQYRYSSRSLQAFKSLHPNYSETSPTAIRMSSSSSDQQKKQSSLVPRAAVSVVVRHASLDNTVKYVLVQRGKQPNKGIWSLPGGKIELGEQSLAAAKRELWEETGLSSEHTEGFNFYWSDKAPICATDSIHFEENDSLENEGEPIGRNVQFHYVISQWFVEMKRADSSTLDDARPTLLASDDAADAKWFNIDDVEAGIKKGEITPGVENVLIRSEVLYEKELL